MSDLKFHCPGCGQHLVCGVEAKGVQVACPSCMGLVTVPSEIFDPETQASPRRRPIAAIILFIFLATGAALFAFKHPIVRFVRVNIRGGAWAREVYVITNIVLLNSTSLDLVSGRHFVIVEIDDRGKIEPDKLNLFKLIATDGGTITPEQHSSNERGKNFSYTPTKKQIALGPLRFQFANYSAQSLPPLLWKSVEYARGKRESPPDGKTYE